METFREFPKMFYPLLSENRHLLARLHVAPLHPVIYSHAANTFILHSIDKHIRMVMNWRKKSYSSIIFCIYLSVSSYSTTSTQVKRVRSRTDFNWKKIPSLGLKFQFARKIFVEFWVHFIQVKHGINFILKTQYVFIQKVRRNNDKGKVM